MLEEKNKNKEFFDKNDHLVEKNEKLNNDIDLTELSKLREKKEEVDLGNGIKYTGEWIGLQMDGYGTLIVETP